MVGGDMKIEEFDYPAIAHGIIMVVILFGWIIYSIRLLMASS